jgi:hypothetical protein
MTTQPPPILPRLSCATGLGPDAEPLIAIAAVVTALDNIAAGPPEWAAFAAQLLSDRLNDLGRAIALFAVESGVVATARVPRPKPTGDPRTLAADALRARTRSRTRAAADVLSAAVEHEHDFAGWLAAVLADVAAAKGGPAALTAGRPGSWEAALVDQLVKGTVGPGDEYLPDADAEPVAP